MNSTMQRNTWRHFVLLAFVVAMFSLSLSAQNLKVTLLGTGTPDPRMDRFGPSILVEAGTEKLIFDCGRGAQQRLAQLKIPPAEVTAVFLTHLHSDHVVGFPDLWLTGWLRGRKLPLRVWGPAGTAQMMSHLTEAYSYDIHIRRDADEMLPAQGVVITAKDIEEGVIYQNGGIKVTAFTVDHGVVKPAFGYRVDFNGRSVVLSGDTRPSENLIKFAKGADVLVHEVVDPVAFRESAPFRDPERQAIIINHHTTAEQAGTVFTRVHPRLAVYSHIVPGGTTNLVPQTRKTYQGPLEVGEDLMSIDIGEKVGVHRPDVR